MNDTYVAINQITSQKYTLVILWSYMTGPHHLDGIHKSRSLARKAATKIAGKKRKLVSLNRLYQLNTEKIHTAYLKSKEK